MYKLSQPSTLSSQNSSIKNKKSEKKEEIITSGSIEESLQNWEVPQFSASDVYKRSSIFKSCPIKTVEGEIPLSEGYTTVPLLSDDLRKTCPKQFSLIHVGMIQVGLKPEKIGSNNASAIICVRDRSSRDFEESLFGMVESRLSDGPIYFSYFPRNRIYSRFVALSADLRNTLRIDVKSEGCGSLMYRMHYRVVRRQGDERTRRSIRYCVDEEGATTLFFTDAARSNGVTSREIFWDAVAVPERWAEWKESAEAHALKVDVPGKLSKEEVRVEVVEGRILQVRGERCMTEQVKHMDGFIMTVMHGNDIKFLRRFTLPENSKPGMMKAAMEDGVLTVTVPKEEVGNKAQVQVIDIAG